MLLSELTDCKTALWGYGVEGKATADYLRHKLPGWSFTILCLPHEADDSEAEFYTDEVSSALLSQFDVVIKSPGISPYSQLAQKANCRFISSSALWFDNERHGTVVAITGTKGKSTVSALVTHVLSSLGEKVVLAGNFGRPLISCLGGEDYVILETSSYQAQDGAIQADLAVLLNLYSEHLNWHLDEPTYQQDKWRLLERARQVILNARDEDTLKWFEKRPPKGSCSWFNQPNGFYELNGNLMYQDKALMSPYGWSLKGHHNIINAAAACEVIQQLKLDIKPALNAMKTFQPLPHRLQTIWQSAGVTYIDDSIASTPRATMAALTTTIARRTILLVGGFDRGLDWDWFAGEIQAQPPKAIICSGENGEKIARAILNRGIKTQCISKLTLADAVKTGKALAKSGDVVLLSPGAPSFDAFDDYQHRGNMFAQWVK